MAAAAVFALSSTGLEASGASHARDAAAALADFYARLSARDIGILRYVPAAGFSEITNGSEPHRLDALAVRSLFASPLAIDLRVEDLKSEAIAGAALVTGVRVGSIRPASEPPAMPRFAFSTLWTQVEGRWQLRHVHLSSAPPRAT